MRLSSQATDASTCNSSFATPLTETNRKSVSFSRKIRAVVRIRPLNTDETREKCDETVRIDTRKHPVAAFAVDDGDLSSIYGTSLMAGGTAFEFDAVLGPRATQQHVYDFALGEEISQNELWGQNISIIAYGQTGVGKTFTMFGPHPVVTNTSRQGLSEVVRRDKVSVEDGVISRAIFDIFKAKQRYDSSSGTTISIAISFLEICNEELRDLLGDDDVELKLINRGDGGVEVRGMATIAVTSFSHAIEVVEKAVQRRAVGSTRMNFQSSRSHAICTVAVTTNKLLPTNISSNKATTAKVTTVTFVDLAGSERLKNTGVTGSQQQESININSDLLALGNVLSALSRKCDNRTRANEHVPYRDSKLTRLLRDSLGGNSFTVFLSCVSPACRHLHESKNTLRYAQRCGRITNVIKQDAVKADASPSQVAALLEENRALTETLKEIQTASRNEIEEKQKRIEELNREVQYLKTELETKNTTAGASPIYVDVSSPGGIFYERPPRQNSPTDCQAFSFFTVDEQGSFSPALFKSCAICQSPIPTEKFDYCESRDHFPVSKLPGNRPDAINNEHTERHLSPPLLLSRAIDESFAEFECGRSGCSVNGDLSGMVSSDYQYGLFASFKLELETQTNISFRVERQLEEIKTRLLGLEQSLRLEALNSQPKRLHGLQPKSSSRPHFLDNLPGIVAFRQKLVQESAKKAMAQASNPNKCILPVIPEIRGGSDQKLETITSHVSRGPAVVQSTRKETCKNDPTMSRTKSKSPRATSRIEHNIQFTKGDEEKMEVEAAERATLGMTASATGKDNCFSFKGASIIKSELATSVMEKEDFTPYVSSPKEVKFEQENRGPSHSKAAQIENRMTDFKVKHVELSETELVLRLKGHYQKGSSPYHAESTTEIPAQVAAARRNVKASMMAPRRIGHKTETLNERTNETPTDNWKFRKGEVVFVHDGNKDIKYDAVVLNDIPNDSGNTWVRVQWQTSKRREYVSSSRVVKIPIKTEPEDKNKVVRRRSARAPQPTNRYTP